MPRPDAKFLSGSRFAAAFGALVLHMGLAAWAMQPTDPVIVPPQQVIRISMAAPSPAPQEQAEPAPQPVPERLPEPVAPPKPDGLMQAPPKPERKAELPPKKREQKKIAKKKEEAPKEIAERKPAPSLAPPTSGRQAPDAKDARAAVTEPVFSADYLNNPPPAYPRAAKRDNVEGKVLLEALVAVTGEPKKVEVVESSGSSLLDKAALKAVQEWRFVPARKGTQLVEAGVLVPIEFALR
jgi:protein TonB